MNLPGSLDIRLLEALVALVEEASVTKAAGRVSMTQPRMSNALARLRTITGDPLLVRSGHGLVPTDRAIEIAAAVQKQLGCLHEAFAKPARFAPAASTRRFILAMSDYVSTLLLPPLLAELENAAPRITVEVKAVEPQLVDRWLDDEDCHLAFGVLPHLNERLRASVLLHDGAACIARHDARDIQGVITLDQYLRRSHVITSGTPTPVSTLEQIVDTTLAEHGHSRRITAKASTGFALAATVAQTDLIATLPVRAATAFGRFLPLQVLELPFKVTPFDITMVWHERVHRDPGHLWLRSLIRALASRVAPLEVAGAGTRHKPPSPGP